MKYEWCYFDEYFTKEKCDLILQLARDYPSQEATIGTQSGFEKIENSRRSKVKFILHTDEKFSWVFNDLWYLARSCNHDHFNFDVTKLDYVQIAEYSSEDRGEYTRHLDAIWCNEPYQFHRKLSCTVQLSDPESYTGGDFEFYDLQYADPNETHKQQMRARGTAIFFPAFITHAVKPVLSGNRYSITAWFEGPKWR